MAECIERAAAPEITTRTCGDYAAAWSEIRRLPAVDAVAVTRCKDCKYMAGALPNDKGFLICPASGMEIIPDDFCSYGEPKEGAHADDHD